MDRRRAHQRWWAAALETPEVEIELRPGGNFYTRMTGPDGFDVKGSACILEVIPANGSCGRALCFPPTATTFPDDGCNGFPFTAIHTSRMPAAADPLHRDVLHKDAKDAQAHDAMGFQDGWGTCAEQLAEIARSLA